MVLHSDPHPQALQQWHVEKNKIKIFYIVFLFFILFFFFFFFF